MLPAPVPDDQSIPATRPAEDEDERLARELQEQERQLAEGRRSTRGKAVKKSRYIEARAAGFSRVCASHCAVGDASYPSTDADGGGRGGGRAAEGRAVQTGPATQQTRCEYGFPDLPLGVRPSPDRRGLAFLQLDDFVVDDEEEEDDDDDDDEDFELAEDEDAPPRRSTRNAGRKPSYREDDWEEGRHNTRSGGKRKKSYREEEDEEEWGEEEDEDAVMARCEGRMAESAEREARALHGGLCSAACLAAPALTQAVERGDQRPEEPDTAAAYRPLPGSGGQGESAPQGRCDWKQRGQGGAGPAKHTGPGPQVVCRGRRGRGRRGGRGKLWRGGRGGLGAGTHWSIPSAKGKGVTEELLWHSTST